MTPGGVGGAGFFGLGSGEVAGLTTSRLFLSIFTEAVGVLSRDERLLCHACSTECSCGTYAKMTSRSLVEQERLVRT